MDINAVARMAGVSRATVSRYLNDGYVSDEKRAAIARVIEETGYAPSQHAKSLRTGRTGLAGVIIPKISSASVSLMVAGITETLSEEGYHPLLANTSNDASLEVSYLQLFSQRGRVDGVILIGTTFTSAHEGAIAGLGVPLVVLGQRLEGCPCVYHDDYHALLEITRHVLARGSRPSYIGFDEHDAAAGRDRRRGFLDACRERGVEVADVPLVESDFTRDGGYLACERLIHQHPSVDTIVCASDDIAFGAITCLREYGRRVPDDVQVTGVGDSSLYGLVAPTLTTVHYRYTKAGSEAARLLMRAMAKGADEASMLCMGFEVVVRNSTR